MEKGYYLKQCILAMVMKALSQSTIKMEKGYYFLRIEAGIRKHITSRNPQ